MSDLKRGTRRIGKAFVVLVILGTVGLVGTTGVASAAAAPHPTPSPTPGPSPTPPSPSRPAAPARPVSVHIATLRYRGASAHGTLTWTGTRSFKTNLFSYPPRGGTVTVQLSPCLSFHGKTACSSTYFAFWRNATPANSRPSEDITNWSLPSEYGWFGFHLTGMKFRLCVKPPRGNSTCGPSSKIYRR